MRYLIIVLASWMLGGCVTKPSVSHYENIPIGSSKEYTCEQYTLIWVNNKPPGGNNALCRYDFQSYYSYFPAFKTEIITNDNRVFYVFEDVDSKINCTFFGCSLGNGRLKLITRDISEARAATNPKYWAEREEAKKNKYLEEQREQVKKDEQERKRLKEREEYERKVKLEFLEKTYGKKCINKKNNITDYNACLFEQERTVLAEKQEQERKANKAKLEEQNKLANMPPSERYAYTCEKTYGFRKGTDNFKECVFKIMTTEYEMQNQLNQRRIAELERKVASNQTNTAYQNEMLEIERMKAKAMQDQVNFARNKDITDTLLGISNNLLNPPRKAAPNAPQIFNCQTRKFGGFDQIQCF